MKPETWRKMGATQICVVLIVAASVSGAPSPHRPTEGFFERRYKNVYSEDTDLNSGTGPAPTVESDDSKSAPTTTLPPEESEYKTSKPRWSTRRRLSDREAVAVMEEELERREAAKSKTREKSPRKEAKRTEAEASPSDRESEYASVDRRSGHHSGVTGPVHTFVKTDKHGHYKWGVRHHAGHM